MGSLRAYLLALISVGLLWPNPSFADASTNGEVTMSAAGAVNPTELPRSRTAPATLDVGFTSAALGSPTVPELSRIGIQVAPLIELQTAGLRSCPLAQLYSNYAGTACARSLVGHGSVDSEITLPGQSPAAVHGKLRAFYAVSDGRPRILAQVITDLVIYVVPFEIKKVAGVGTRLIARKMRNVKGICRPHPDCFGQRYSFEGIYGHISNFEMSLHRTFFDSGTRKSFVSARCPAPGRMMEASLPVLKVSLDYGLGSSLAATVRGNCRVSTG